ncbi:MAG: hypothetical protein KDD44_14315, partial [Bdellovibrionales bacterium]|nr:hypothetical protein [Bdellovibrionales bacterium]
MKPNSAVFELFEQFVRDLGEKTDLSSEALAEYARSQGSSPVLFYRNPAVQSALSQLRDVPNVERILNWTVRDFIHYFHVFIEQGYRYGVSESQMSWLGRPVLKTPFDLWMYQELVYRTKPEIIIELGVKFGGTASYFANLFDLLGSGMVIGVDIDLSLAADLSHPRISLIEGSSIDPNIVERVCKLAEGKRTIVIADSNHESKHVYAELCSYHHLVNVGSYFIVEDGLQDIMRWNPVPSDGPLVASRRFLGEHENFIADRK